MIADILAVNHSRRLTGEVCEAEGGSSDGTFSLSFVGGLLGTGLMDVAEILMERVRVTSGSG